MAALSKNQGLLRHEGGGATFWMILWMIVFVVFGGVAVDSSNGWRQRVELQ
ncbi:hypothetical protein N8071_01090 [bacterium]|nr:hypothetical protein [bacterium]